MQKSQNDQLKLKRLLQSRCLQTKVRMPYLAMAMPSLNIARLCNVFA